MLQGWKGEFERACGRCIDLIPVQTLEGHEDDILCIDFNHPKGVLVSSSLDGTIRAWDLHRSRCLGALEGHSSLVRCLQLEDACLLTGSDDGSIRHWDLSLVPPAPSPSSVGSSSGFSSSAPNSPALSAATTTDEALPMLSDCCISTLEGHQAEVTAIYTDKATAVSYDCRGRKNGIIYYWEH